MERVKVKEAASLLGVSEQYIRIGIQRGWLPIGSCVKLKNRWIYQIPRERLDAYMQGKDLIDFYNKKTRQRQLTGTTSGNKVERTEL